MQVAGVADQRVACLAAGATATLWVRSYSFRVVAEAVHQAVAGAAVVVVSAASVAAALAVAAQVAAGNFCIELYETFMWRWCCQSKKLKSGMHELSLISLPQ